MAVIRAALGQLSQQARARRAGAVRAGSRSTRER
jgi:hypothetical protein